MSSLLIQSSIFDNSTDDFLDWFLYLGGSFFQRINDRMEISTLTIEINKMDKNVLIKTKNGEEIKSINFNSYWYRRGLISLEHKLVNIDSSIMLTDDYLAFLNSKDYKIKQSISDIFDFSPTTLNRFKDIEINKISVLLQAQSIGLLVPDTIITNDYIQVQKFQAKHDKIITKPIDVNRLNFKIKDIDLNLVGKVAIIDHSNIILLEQFSERSLPSLFQKFIDKKIEIRVFFIKGFLFSMAIFSQQSEMTKLDYRNYDTENPNRCVPYKLPKRIELRISSLMRKLELDSGSIDMILSKENKYVFLEVNPIGHYQWLEKKCNYPISQLLAKMFISNLKVKQNDK